MLNIINNIVDISKIEAGLMDVNIKESNINEQIDYIYTFFKPEVEAKNMWLFHKKGLQAKEAFIMTDREKLFAILTNLVKNAIKYSEKGCIEFGYVAGEDSGMDTDVLTFYVKDTGIGIHKEKIDIIFDRFRQVSEGYNRNYEGVGLGLSITKAYVEMLGGKIWVESEEGIGTCFYFTLPYNVKSDNNASIRHYVPVKEPDDVKPLKILIAEDDETASWLLTSIIKPYTETVTIVRSGFEAIQAFDEHPETDLILMDVRMPGINGHEATRRIREKNKEVVIFAQTAFGLTCDLKDSMEAGCNEHISKPINKNELKKLIRKYFVK